jgi:plastocyanin
MRVKSLVLPGLAAVVVAIIAFSLAGHATRSSGTQAAVTATSGAVTVAIDNFAFGPPKLTVKVGTRVTFTNHDGTAHTATADQGSFDSGTLNQGQSMTIQFNKPGIFTYHCSFHAFMTGSIDVVS